MDLPWTDGEPHLSDVRARVQSTWFRCRIPSFLRPRGLQVGRLDQRQAGLHLRWQRGCGPAIHVLFAEMGRSRRSVSTTCPRAREAQRSACSARTYMRVLVTCAREVETSAWGYEGARFRIAW
jgi:hypothetical protein